MSQKPFFSIIIPTYNRASFLPKAIESVLKQIYSNWELIIVDDASTDNTQDVIAQYNDSRIITIKNEVNLERSASRNRGIDIARGQYLLFLDSDDYYLPSHLNNFFNLLSLNDLKPGLYYANANEDTDGNIVNIKHPIDVGLYKKFKNLILYPIAMCKICISADALLKHKFNEQLRIGEDLDLWVRILKEYPLFYGDFSSIVINNHNDRTVIKEEILARKSNYYLAKKILNTHKDCFLKKDRGEVLASCCFAIAKTYYKYNKLLKVIIYLFLSFYYHPFDPRNKEKMYMIYAGLIKK